MPWRIELADSVARQLRKLERQTARRLTSYLRERMSGARDPRSLGAALTGDEPGQFWKYRVGDYRLIAEIRGRELRILIVCLGHRRDVYR